jgi:transglutaminase-like putative cysteine protease
MLMAAATLMAVQSAGASCVLKITKAGPCLSTGAYGTPEIGTPYGVRVTFDVTGTPKPFGIEFTIANVTHTFDNISVKAGKGYYDYFSSSLCLDDTIPYSVTLDPGNVSGNTNPATTVSGVFSPAPPATMVQTYSPSTDQGENSRTIIFAPGATLTNLYALLGDPTSHGAQVVVSSSATANAEVVLTPPYNLPVFQILQSAVASGTFTFSNAFTVTLSKMRVNPGLLRKITWDSLGTLTPEYTQWLTPDSINESTDPSITAFVANALPADYRNTLTPYDAARTLHRAVMRALTYEEPPPHDDAVASLQAGVGDCGCYSAILVASLRSIGIPARRISGFWRGFSQSHVNVEFYLPGAGWLDADPTLGNGADPTGTYAYFFGSVSNADEFVAVDVGDLHEMSDFSINAGDLQIPNIWYWSNSAVNIDSDDFYSYLQPGLTAEYTLLLKPAESGAGIPQGTGYGLLTMSSTGGIILAGELADGESFSTSGALGGDGGDQFIINAPLSYVGEAQGALSGTLNFVTTTGPFLTTGPSQTTGAGDIGGTIGWVKPQVISGSYPGAFQTSLNVIGSLYRRPVEGSSVLPGFTLGTLTLSGTGALTASGDTVLVKDISLNAKNDFSVKDPGADKLKLTITSATGLFTGTFMDASPGHKAVLTDLIGVVFQQGANGGGFFVGTENSGGVVLTP